MWKCGMKVSCSHFPSIRFRNNSHHCAFEGKNTSKNILDEVSNRNIGIERKSLFGWIFFVFFLASLSMLSFIDCFFVPRHIHKASVVQVLSLFFIFMDFVACVMLAFDWASLCVFYFLFEFAYMAHSQLNKPNRKKGTTTSAKSIWTEF